eukprot:1420905-Pyramimonas_sp.AAC.1
MQSLADFTSKIVAVDSRLDSCLDEYGYGQIPSKQEFLMFFAERSYLCRQLLRHQPGLLHGSVRDHVGYLGPYLSMSVSARSEISR